jgi:hypothetical protein
MADVTSCCIEKLLFLQMNPAASSNSRYEWSTIKYRPYTYKFGKQPCWFQIKVAEALYARKDVIGCTPTGAGTRGTEEKN